MKRSNVFSTSTSSIKTAWAFNEASMSWLTWLKVYIRCPTTSIFFCLKIMSILLYSGVRPSSPFLSEASVIWSESTLSLSFYSLDYVTTNYSNLKLSYMSSTKRSESEWYLINDKSLSKMIPYVSKSIYLIVIFLYLSINYLTIARKYPHETGSNSGS